MAAVKHPIDRVAGEVAVIALALAGQQHVPAMVDVVVPLGVVADRLSVAVARQPVRLVLLVFEDEVDVAIGKRLADALGELVEEVLRAVVENGVDGIEA